MDQPQHDAGVVDARGDSAAELLRMVLGAGVVAALREGFLKGGDFTGVVPLLVAAGAKPHLAAAARAALATACDTGRAGVAALLLEAEGVRAADANAGSTHESAVHNTPGGFSLLTAACIRGDSGVVRALVGSGKADPNGGGTNGYLPLVEAADNGNAACLAALLAAPGIDVNQADVAGDRALACASGRGNTLCVQALLAAGGVDANLLGFAEGERTALTAAASTGQTECVRALLAVPRGAVDVNKADDHGATALIVAAEAAHAGCTAVLLAVDGIDVNQADGNGHTALVHAAGRGDVVCVRALLAADGIDANHATTGGDTALTVAAECDRMACALALLAVDGIDANHTTNDGYTALDLAAAADNADLVRAFLAARGVDVGHRDGEGDAALHHACELRNAEMALLCLMAGGCRFARNASGRTPLALAADDTAVRAVFRSGADYWQRRWHSGGAAHSPAVDRSLPDDVGGYALHQDYHTRLLHQDDDRFCVLQVVVKASTGGFSCWQRWGRLGERESTLAPASSAGDAVEKFCRAFRDKTGTAWAGRGAVSVPHGGRYRPVATARGRYSWSLRRVVQALMLVRQRLGAAPPAAESAEVEVVRGAGAAALPLVRLPEEIWLLVCGFLRSADFPPPARA